MLGVCGLFLLVGLVATVSPLHFPLSPFAPPPRRARSFLPDSKSEFFSASPPPRPPVFVELVLLRASLDPPPWLALSGALPVRLRRRTRVLPWVSWGFWFAAAKRAGNAPALPPPRGFATSKQVSSSPMLTHSENQRPTPRWSGGLLALQRARILHASCIVHNTYQPTKQRPHSYALRPPRGGLVGVARGRLLVVVHSLPWPG